MLAEHRRALKKLKEQDRKQEKPEFFPEYRREIDYKLQKAQFENKRIEVTYFNNGQQKKVRGVIKMCLPQKKILIIKQHEPQPEQTYHLEIENVLEIKIL